MRIFEANGEKKIKKEREGNKVSSYFFIRSLPSQPFGFLHADPKFCAWSPLVFHSLEGTRERSEVRECETESLISLS